MLHVAPAIRPCMLIMHVRMQTSEADLCLSYYEHQCAGICSSEKRLASIYQACLQDPLRTGANPGALPEIDEGNIQKV